MSLRNKNEMKKKDFLLVNYNAHTYISIVKQNSAEFSTFYRYLKKNKF